MGETKIEAEAKPVKTKAQESVYTVRELIQSAETAIKQPRDCVTAALVMSGKDVMTLEEAKRTVKKFMERKIR